MKITLSLLGSLLTLVACKSGSPEPAKPTVGFTLPANAEATVPAAFQNTSQNAATYKWNFGDGSASTVAAPTHTYAKAGTYQVTLHAYGAQQDSTAINQGLTVTDYQIFAHASARIAGTYDCRVYRSIVYYSSNSGSSIYTRQRDTVLTVVATGSQTLTINRAAGNYTPNPVYLVPPNGPGYPFKVNLAEYSIAHFYSAGDSLLLTEWSHVGHAYTTTDYYRAKRRP